MLHREGMRQHEGQTGRLVDEEYTTYMLYNCSNDQRRMIFFWTL